MKSGDLSGINSEVYNKYIHQNMFPLLLEINSRKLDLFCKNSSFSNILFLSREGYSLQKAYERWHQLRNHHLNVPSEYLFVSRRAINRYLLGTSSFQESLTSHELYEGTIAKLFTGRFGLTNQEIYQRFEEEKLQQYISWGDRLKLIEVQRELSSIIYENPLSDRECGNLYLKSRVSSSSLVVDIGFKGTMQESLSALLQLDLTGFYFVISEDAWLGKKSSAIDDLLVVASLLKNSLLLEKLCAAPQGSVLRYQSLEGKITPVLKRYNGDKDESVLRFALKKMEDYVKFTDYQIQELFIASWWQVVRAIKQLGDGGQYHFEIEDDWSRDSGVNESD